MARLIGLALAARGRRRGATAAPKAHEPGQVSPAIIAAWLGHADRFHHADLPARAAEDLAAARDALVASLAE